VKADSWRERMAWASPRGALLGAPIVIALLALGIGVWYWQAAEERRASSVYAAAMARLATARGQDAAATRVAAARDLEAALETYPSAGMAAQAALELASVRYADRQYAPARSAYEVALARAGSATLRTLARLGIASTWEAERDFPKAADTYRAVLGDLKPQEFQYEETLIDLARVQELAGRKDEAIQTYRRLLKDVPSTRRAEDVRTRLASLGATP
jgi:tetratricopeptide (TPR) repeat protein